MLARQKGIMEKEKVVEGAKDDMSRMVNYGDL